jgi:hypothetical protein
MEMYPLKHYTNVINRLETRPLTNHHFPNPSTQPCSQPLSMPLEIASNDFQYYLCGQLR